MASRSKITVASGGGGVGRLSPPLSAETPLAQAQCRGLVKALQEPCFDLGQVSGGKAVDRYGWQAVGRPLGEPVLSVR